MLLPEKYEVIRSLGSGNFGEVFLVKHKHLNRFEAVKIIETAKIEEALKEARILQTLKHDHIVEIYDADILQNKQGIFISMGYYPKGSVTNIRFIGRRHAIDIAVHILRALEYAHYKGYVHRDIKPSNILLDEKERGLLSDFGLSVKIDEIADAPSYKYIYHIAPEVISRNKKDSPLTDIYALGVTLYRLINGEPGWLQEITFNELKEKIIKGKFPDRTWYRPDIPIALVKIINKALDLNYKNKRYQSAAAMRLDIEKKVKLEYDWEQRSNGWYARAKDHDIEIAIQCKGDKFNITTSQKSIDFGQFRRIKKYCFSKIDKGEVDNVIHEIISEIDSRFVP